MPQFIDLQQNSPEWLEWRQGGIGCSDIPVVLEESPFKSAYGLWLEKCHMVKPKPATRAMTHGTNSEAAARQWYIDYTHQLADPVVAVYDEAEWLRASVDGWNPIEQHGVEIKCPTTATAFRRAKEGHIPWFYMLQMYGAMEILDAKSWDYCCWYEGDGVIIPVKRDPDLWATEILPTLSEFWERVQSKHWPKPEGEAFEESEAWFAAAQEWLETETLAGEIEDRALRATAALRRMSTARFTNGGGLRTRWEQWRPRSQVTLTANNPEDAARILELIEGNDEIMELVRKDRDGTKLWQTDFPPNLVFKIEATNK